MKRDRTGADQHPAIGQRERILVAWRVAGGVGQAFADRAAAVAGMLVGLSWATQPGAHATTNASMIRSNRNPFIPRPVIDELTMPWPR